MTTETGSAREPIRVSPPLYDARTDGETVDTNDDLCGDEYAIGSRLDRLEAGAREIERKVDEALHLARHQLVITGTRSHEGKPLSWAHCRCQDWDLRGPDVDLLAEEHHSHVDLLRQPTLFG